MIKAEGYTRKLNESLIECAMAIVDEGATAGLTTIVDMLHRNKVYDSMGTILGTASLAKEYTEDPAGRKGSAKEAEKTTVRSKQTKAGKRQAPTSTNFENERKSRHSTRIKSGKKCLESILQQDK